MSKKKIGRKRIYYGGTKSSPDFHRWMRRLHAIVVKEFHVPIGSLSEKAYRPGSPEEDDWYPFYVDCMTPRQAIIDDLLNS